MVKAFREREEEREIATNQRLATLLAEMRNGRRGKRTDKVWTAEDFFKPPNRKDPWGLDEEEKQKTMKVLGPEEAAKVFSAWARTHNRRIGRA